MVKAVLSGMGKEDLMKFANDPFWIRMRWALFVLFWLIWAAMLAGAIAIIVMAPKCSAPEPKKVWEESPIVELDVSDVSIDLKERIPILDDLKNQHIKAISLSSLVKASADGMYKLKRHTHFFRIRYTVTLIILIYIFFFDRRDHRF